MEVRERVELSHLFGPHTDLDALPWRPFRPDVDIMIIYGHIGEGPCTALLRYQPGANVPRHRHAGMEHIIVLRGEQSDDDAKVSAGTLLIKPPGTSHEIISSKGCVVLAIWEKPVVFE